MTPDHSAQLRQLRDHVKAVRVDLSAIRAAGGDRKAVESARWELYFTFKLAMEALEKKEKLNERSTSNRVPVEEAP